MARLDFTAGNILLATELDELARQATSNVTAAGKPSATAEGETIAVTDSDRLEHWNGSAWQRGTNWASGGRTWVTKPVVTATLGDGSVGEIGWTGGTDPDSFYTGWTGSVNNFTVPSGLGGIYIMTVRIRWAGAWTTDPEDRLRITISGPTIFDYHQGGFGANYIATLMYPLAAATTVSVQLEQNSGVSQDISSGDFTMVRLCI
jgi:hypothetical protein